MRRTTMLPVLLGTALFVGAGYAVTVLLPVADRANTTRTGSTPSYTKGEAAGRDVYVNQGCVYCHTQQVRDTFTDAGLAERPTRAGDTLGARPGLLGQARYGPDLACVGDRVPGAAEDAGHDAQVAAMVAYLQDPAGVHPGSTMPSYRHLSATQLRRLASYLVALHCAGVAK